MSLKARRKENGKKWREIQRGAIYYWCHDALTWSGQLFRMSSAVLIAYRHNAYEIRKTHWRNMYSYIQGEISSNDIIATNHSSATVVEIEPRSIISVCLRASHSIPLDLLLLIIIAVFLTQSRITAYARPFNPRTSRAYHIIDRPSLATIWSPEILAGSSAVFVIRDGKGTSKVQCRYLLIRYNLIRFHLNCYHFFCKLKNWESMG